MDNNTLLTLFPGVEPPQARFSVLRLHSDEPYYYVVDDHITAYVRLFGAQGAVPYSFAQACREAEQRNALAGFPIGAYELCIRQAADLLFRDKLAVPWEIEEALARKNADLFYSLSGGKDSDAMIVQLECLRRRRKKHRRNRRCRCGTRDCLWIFLLPGWDLAWQSLSSAPDGGPATAAHTRHGEKGGKFSSGP